MHLCCVSEMYSSNASPAQVDIQMPNDLSDSSKDVRLKVFVQQIGRRIDDEYNVGLLATLNDRFCHKMNKKHLMPSLFLHIIKSIKYNRNYYFSICSIEISYMNHCTPVGYTHLFCYENRTKVYKNKHTVNKLISTLELHKIIQNQVTKQI